jgi:hypothetical protein
MIGCSREVEVVASLLDRRRLRIDDAALAANVDGVVFRALG